MTNDTILVIEDDKSIRNFLRLALKNGGFEPLECDRGLAGISLFLSHRPSLVLLDLGLPDIDGMEVLAHIREESHVPVVIVSARGQEREKVEALDKGADDYITKPFGVDELMARVRAALRKRRPEAAAARQFALDGLLVDYEKRKVLRDGEEIHLTPIEYKMLVLLTQNAGKVVTHRYIQEAVWGCESGDDYQALRVFMANIRKKIEKSTACPRFILTEMGVGYRFADE